MDRKSEQDRCGLSVSLAQSEPIPLDVQLSCESGELLALVGPSGSGKTTVLRSIAGLYAPIQGRVVCDGTTWLDSERDVRVAPQRRRVGLVFQHYALFPHLRAIDNVSAAMTHLAADKRRQRATDLLALVNMAGLEGRRPAELSGGQRQRVALARALARDPTVLLLDEPFSAVDQMTRRRLRLELAQLRNTIRIPVVFVTHDLDEAQLLADRLSVLHHGRTLQSGVTRVVMRQPASAEVARLLDHRNVFQGRVVTQDSEGKRTWIEWTGMRLECRFAPDFSPGDTVSWLIPQSEVVLHRRDRPSRGEHENPVPGSVTEMITLGDDALVTMAVTGSRESLAFMVSLHVARRNRVALGESIGVSLLADGIHLMPYRGSRHR